MIPIEAKQAFILDANRTHGMTSTAGVALKYAVAIAKQ